MRSYFSLNTSAVCSSVVVYVPDCGYGIARHAQFDNYSSKTQNRQLFAILSCTEIFGHADFGDTLCRTQEKEIRRYCVVEEEKRRWSKKRETAMAVMAVQYRMCCRTRGCTAV